MNKDRKRIAELDTIIKKFCESFAIGRITDERFDTLLAEYEAEQKAGMCLRELRKNFYRYTERCKILLR